MINITTYAPLLKHRIYTLDELLKQFEVTPQGTSFLAEGMFDILERRLIVYKTAFQASFDDEMDVFFGIRWSWYTRVGAYLWIYYWGESPEGITDVSPPRIYLREMLGRPGILYVADDGPTVWEPFPLQL